MGIDEIGKLVVDMMIKAGYVFVTVIAIRDILTALAKHDKEGIWDAFIHAVAGYGAILIVPKALLFVKEKLG